MMEPTTEEMAPSEAAGNYAAGELHPIDVAVSIFKQHLTILSTLV